LICGRRLFTADLGGNILKDRFGHLEDAIVVGNEVLKDMFFMLSEEFIEFGLSAVERFVKEFWVVGTFEKAGVTRDLVVEI
jgi:hypothetical protein